LALSMAWILLGALVYFALKRVREQSDREQAAAATEITPEAED